jgi:hypothetical protein
MSGRILSTVTVRILGVMVVSVVGFAQLTSGSYGNRLQGIGKMTIAVAPRGLTVSERCGVLPQVANQAHEMAIVQQSTEGFTKDGGRVSGVKGANESPLSTETTSDRSNKLTCRSDAACGSGQCWRGFCEASGYCQAYWTCV